MATKSIKLPNRVKKQAKVHEAAGTKTVTKGNKTPTVTAPSSNGHSGK